MIDPPLSWDTNLITKKPATQLGYSGEQEEVDDPSLEEITRLPIKKIFANNLSLPSFNNFLLGTFHHQGCHQDAGQQGERISGLHRGGEQTNHLYSTPKRVGDSIAITAYRAG